MKKYFPVLILLMMTGCSHYAWQKLGATQQDFNNDKYTCMQSAVAAAPAAVGNTAVWNNGAGQANGGSASWNGGGGALKSYDVNAPTRNNLMKACLQAKGWQWAVVRNTPQTQLETAPVETTPQSNSAQ